MGVSVAAPVELLGARVGGAVVGVSARVDVGSGVAVGAGEQAASARTNKIRVKPLVKFLKDIIFLFPQHEPLIAALRLSGLDLFF